MVLKNEMTQLNKALRQYQTERPSKLFWAWCKDNGYVDTFDKDEKKNARELSKSLRV